eukprot:TRINITY_DN60434_c0_g1_i1.p1 TRINITY_DN60434_c0_g1~~TRINITY_DN60434_c0_g1_i1.p1  ORF type:complete len:254 (-),score=34.40 TRINITY_DN60434_c0_g1_i1:100-861(-)
MGQITELRPTINRLSLVSQFVTALENGEKPEVSCDLVDGGYDTIHGHLYCRIVCRLDLKTPGAICEWRIQRRLSQIREKLHDVVKTYIGSDRYCREFHPDTPFAHRGSFKVPGNGRRTKRWLGRLVNLCSAGKLDKQVVKHTLDFLVEPSFSALELVTMNLPWCEHMPLPDPSGIDTAGYAKSGWLDSQDDDSSSQFGYTSDSDTPPLAPSLSSTLRSSVASEDAASNSDEGKLMTTEVVAVHVTSGKLRAAA